MLSTLRTTSSRVSVSRLAQVCGSESIQRDWRTTYVQARTAAPLTARPLPGMQEWLTQRKRSDGVLHVLGDAERDFLRRLDLDLLAGGGIAPEAGGALADLHDAKPGDAHLVALLQVFHRGRDEIIEYCRQLLFGHFVIVGQFGDNFG